MRTIFFVLVFSVSAHAVPNVDQARKAARSWHESATTEYDCFLPNMPTRGIAAHAGDSLWFPENTLPALQSAIDLGAHQIEFDIVRAADGFVLLHDLTVDRATNGTGLVRDKTIAELQALTVDVHWSGATGQIATLEDALSIMPPDVWLNLHLKPASGDHYAMTRDVALLIEEKGRGHQSIFSTTSQDGVSGMLSVSRHFFNNNMGGQRMGSDYVTETIEGRHDWIQFLNFDRQLPDINDMVELELAGVRSNFYMGNTWSLDEAESAYINQLWDRGVDFVLVEDVAGGMELFSGQVATIPEPSTFTMALCLICWFRRLASVARRR